ncbi:glycoside hydrolase family 16 protein [Lepidopterella palustris CBS 459.81]|uniref:endo-1,3(4)-beta-glucanase n=1 Tax=Lepidopterella palustris CBS 459.81 TaxID=1314670 RepID=A0A8E2EBI6_9PEZI|nr:glycoside hydrolase family 16 protein [Lepidopterella palustris CBS 459.81]
MLFSTLLTCAAFIRLSIAGYVLEDDYTSNFFDKFDFFTSSDPTNGFVSYVDQSTAQSRGLISTSSGIYMGVDHTNVTPNGRPSVRLTSKKSYNAGLVILDLAHMPAGCGTWPAFWMVGPNWPNSGEIDIIEGVNEQTTNAMTLHTGAGCSITNTGGFSGSITTSNCDVNAAGQFTNAGCQIMESATNSFGAGFNSNNGGVYATMWTSSAISIYFFPRGSIPSDITSGSPDPSGWGTPAAVFMGSCDIANTFKNQQIVFDTTFCGDWAGNVWTSGSCASKAATCNAFVENNPSAFANAYWSINSLKVYQSSSTSTSQNIAASSKQISSAAAASSAMSISSIEISTYSSIVQTTFAISTKPAAASSSSTSNLVSTIISITPTALPNPTTTSIAVTTPPFPIGNSTRPAGFPTGSGLLTVPYPFPSGNSTNTTFPSGSGFGLGGSNGLSQPTIYTTLTLTETVPNPGNSVITSALAATSTPEPAQITFSALPASFFPSHEHGPPAKRAERRKRDLLRHRKRHGGSGDF